MDPSILRFAAAQLAAEAATARLEEQADVAVLASRARVARKTDGEEDAPAPSRGLTPPTPGAPRRRGRSRGATTASTRLVRRRTPASEATAAVAAAVQQEMDHGSGGSGGSGGAIRPPPTSPTALASAVVADRRAALAAAAAVAQPPAIPATSWPYPPSLPLGTSARLTPWPTLRAPLATRPLPSFPASDGRRAGRAEPLWWPPPGSGVRFLASAPTLNSSSRLSGTGAGTAGTTTAPTPAPSTSGRGPQHAAEAALASSRLSQLAVDALAPSPAPSPRPPPGWAGPAFVVRRSRVAGLGLYILVAAPQGAYLLDYSGTVVRGGGVADARERAYTGSGGGWCEAGGTYMFNCGPAVWGGSSGSRRGAPPLSMMGAAAFLAHAAAHNQGGPAATTPRACLSTSRGAPPTLVVDATQAGSAARFINHSCAPNCVAIVEPPATAWGGWLGGLSGDATAGAGAARGGAAVAAGLPRVSLYAARALVPGEELFFEYRLSPPEPGDPALVCGCGAVGCRGVL